MGITRAANSTAAVTLLLAATTPAATCSEERRLHALDFWLGRWVVTWESEFVGHNIIETDLGGCVVTERWLDVKGRAAFSLFGYDRDEDRWIQVFVTDRALDVGATKQKAEVTALTTPTRIRFQGRYPGRTDGALIEDRTTLTLEEPGASGSSTRFRRTAANSGRRSSTGCTPARICHRVCNKKAAARGPPLRANPSQDW